MIPGFYDHERPLVIRISFTTFVLCTVCLPLLGLIACVLISSVYHFDESTKTHCYVPNYLPSISASISQSPECHIWRFCIGLHSAPRFLVAFIYFKFYKMCFTSKFPERSLAYLSLAFSVLENLGLLLLSYVSSKETYLLHQEGFILFILSSLIYMLITCRLWKTIKRMPNLITGKSVFYFSTFASALLPDSFTSNTTCTVSQGSTHSSPCLSISPSSPTWPSTSPPFGTSGVVR
ncbi:post-GPI attachment to proteins factor 2-like isoform X3 [Dunckerocampus dactyliophorus]|uniref:post-GPI attachment to proteins factor 2-like isoform X3 n=1 Tax=Dunckerocampus dactyliophorus TaxID=161453 RepID=UPI002405F58C|nr:post-GPI attachment to proteins factor 2-like isoform X3 [Dunckerocampus dactyliophorus]